jgi:hypothetical protein
LLFFVVVSFFGAILGAVSIAGRTKVGLSSAFEVGAFTQMNLQSSIDF